MRLEILAVPDCPNVTPLRDRLDVLLAGRDDVQITTTVIDTVAAAERAGMHGSPTLLVNGIDPFADDRQPTSVSCRIYRDETGMPDGAPSMAQLRTALSDFVTSAVAGVTPDCCSAAYPDAGEGLRLRRARTAPTDPVDRAIHQSVLRAFATTGEPPAGSALDRVAAAHGVAAGPVLARLHDTDVIRLDTDAGIAVAYPFSTTPTRHRVELASGVQVWAMCAVDALGMAAMLHADARITSTDPTSGASITVTVHNGSFSWDPPTAVVFYSAAAGTGPSADCCCNDLNTFAAPATAQEWMTAHPTTPGQLLGTTAAEQLGTHIFGHLLDNPD